MVSLIAETDGPQSNPLDVVERILAAHEWPFERFSDEEISVNIDGPWCRYHLWFHWVSESAAVQFTCAFDVKVPETRRVDIQVLLSIINSRLWLGHFTLWAEDGALMFRHAQLMGGAVASAAQFEDLVSVALSECERYYPAFQFVIWGGKSPVEAVAAAMIDTVGEA